MPSINVKPRSIYLTLSVIMTGLVIVLYAALATYQFEVGKRHMLEQAAATFGRVGREAVAAIEGELQPARITVSLLARTPLLAGERHAERLAQLPLLAGALRANPSLSAVYGGTGNGSFVLLRALPNADLRRQMLAPAGAAFLLQSVDRDGGAPKGLYLFYDERLSLLEARERPDYDFDPRSRPWFELAQAARDEAAIVQTAPYLFFTTREVGLTLANARGPAVAGVDVSLATLSEMLARQQITPSAELMIVDAQGAVLAHSRRERPPADAKRLPTVDELASPVLRQLWGARTQAPAEPILTVDGREWVVRLEPLPAGRGGDQAAAKRLMLAVAAPRDELQADAIRARDISIAITAGILLLMLPLVHWAANLVSRPLRQLAREAEAIRRFEFDGPDSRRSMIREVDQLAVAMTGMKHSLRRFLEISNALSAERQFDTLLDRLLEETISVAEATGGAIHLLTPDGRHLEPAASRLRGEQSDGSALYRWDVGDPDSPSAAVQALRADRSFEREVHWDDPKDLATFGRLFKRLQSSHFRVLALPLKNRQNEPMGTLSLTFVLDDGGHRANLTPSRVAFIEALSGTAAVAIDNQLLLRARKELLESFIQLVAGAIDAKSPYTGAHCQRVPELTKLLARAACDAKEGPYAAYQLSEDQWEALHIAAWLHDCGKVTTPEFVVDKATKLETIYDRIHEIRTRFEVLKRDARIERLERCLTPAQLEQIAQDLTPVLAELDEEFAFVASCNPGAEFLAPEKAERLRRIGSRTWSRTLDDALGVSNDERKRRQRKPVPLPAREQLLADKPEHIVERPEAERLAPDNVWGFNVQQPEHLYNRGELHNLTVSRGTLTDEERYKINEHIIQTIRMLGELPFPRHLRQVPEIAGGHHERMDGAGYPRGLTREQMSPEARMMAIADIFEALTADDRPYKAGKMLSEAISIMAKMRANGHVDPDLFELFLRSGVYLDYAKRFMNPEQIDAVEVEAVLA